MTQEQKVTMLEGLYFLQHIVYEATPEQFKAIEIFKDDWADGKPNTTVMPTNKSGFIDLIWGMREILEQGKEINGADVVVIQKTTLNKNNTSGYIGVFHTPNKKKPWMASVSFGGKQTYIGSYFTPEEAAQAYNDFVIKNKLNYIRAEAAQ